jgi:hypothetical protein
MNHPLIYPNRMPRFEVYIEKDTYVKYMNMSELIIMVKDKFLNWREQCAEIFLKKMNHKRFSEVSENIFELERDNNKTHKSSS